MNKINKFFKDKNIKYVLFDMDSTLVDTSTYFTEEMIKVISKSICIIFPDIDEDKRNEISNEIREICRSIHRANGVPMLVYELTYKGILKYFNQNKIKYNQKRKVKIFIKEQYFNFYLTSPYLYPSTLSVLNEISNCEIPIFVYSHAQTEWTQIKIDEIRKEYTKRYNKDINIPFFTTDIKDTKDRTGWGNAAKYHNINIKETLVVGDSISSDILPAIEAGYINLIYITNNKEIEKLDIDSNINFKIVNNIGEIFDNI